MNPTLHPLCGINRAINAVLAAPTVRRNQKMCQKWYSRPAGRVGPLGQLVVDGFLGGKILPDQRITPEIDRE